MCWNLYWYGLISRRRWLSSSCSPTRRRRHQEDWLDILNHPIMMGVCNIADISWNEDYDDISSAYHQRWKMFSIRSCSCNSKCQEPVEMCNMVLEDHHDISLGKWFSACDSVGLPILPHDLTPITQRFDTMICEPKLDSSTGEVKCCRDLEYHGGKEVSTAGHWRRGEDSCSILGCAPLGYTFNRFMEP